MVGHSRRSSDVSGEWGEREGEGKRFEGEERKKKRGIK
jgi:hypothetical protein